MTKSNLTWEEATRKPKGNFGVGNRQFEDRELSVDEQRDFLKALNERGAATVGNYVICALNALKLPDEKEIDEVWLSYHLSNGAVQRTFDRLILLTEGAGLEVKPNP